MTVGAGIHMEEESMIYIRLSIKYINYLKMNSVSHYLHPHIHIKTMHNHLYRHSHKINSKCTTDIMYKQNISTNGKSHSMEGRDGNSKQNGQSLLINCVKDKH